MPADSVRPAPQLARRILAGAIVAGLLVAGIQATAASAHPRRGHGHHPAHLRKVGRRHPRPERVGAVLGAAWAALGTPYVYAWEHLHHGFDCSGLTQWAWRHGGVPLPRNAYSQWRWTRHVGIRHIQPGDLLFFYRPIEHVAIFIGHGRMIEAAHTGTRVRVHRIFWGILTAASRPGTFRSLPLDRRRRLDTLYEPP